MNDSGSGERRAFYRLRYPESERPKLLADNMECDVLELSESGARLAQVRRHFRTGRTVSGAIQFAEGDAVEVEGTVLRIEGAEVVVQLTMCVSLKRMLEEQRRLIQQYPSLFARPGDSAERPSS